MSRKRRTVWIIVGLVVAAVVIRLITLPQRREPQREEAILSVAVETVKPGRVVSSLELLGTVMGERQVQVFPEFAGRVTERLKKEGDRVRKDEPILALRSEAVGFEFEPGVVRSPIAGVVGKILVDVGQMVAPQVPVALVVDYDRVKVQIQIPEHQLPRITPGRKGEVRVDAYPDRVFVGQLTELSPVLDLASRTATARLSLANPSQRLTPGMVARVRLILDLRDGVISVPKEALVDGSVFVVEDGVAVRRSVKLGLSGDERVEIQSGLTKGEEVVVIGQERLHGGERVEAVEASE
jgi:membrane fusion protein (multidrug efflux system)